MSVTEIPTALAREALEGVHQARTRQWLRPVLTALFAAAAVVFASSLAVVTGLV